MNDAIFFLLVENSIERKKISYGSRVKLAELHAGLPVDSQWSDPDRSGRQPVVLVPTRPHRHHFLILEAILLTNRQRLAATRIG